MSKLELFGLLAGVKRETNKGLLAQTAEILRLRFAKGQVGAYEYFKYRLFDDSIYGHDKGRKETVAGYRREQDLDNRFNHTTWKGLTTDKLVQYAVFQGLGIPIPEMYALHHPSGRFFGNVTCTTTRQDLARLLRETMVYPFFTKPAHGSFGDRTTAVRQYNEAEDSVELIRGEHVPIEKFIDGCQPRQGVYPWQSGYIFQELIRPHADVFDICGPRLTSVRVIVLLADDGPKIARAVWKVATGNNIVDNFQHGRTGNLLGDIDVSSGAVRQVIGGLGLGRQKVHVNPDTGKSFEGFVIPNWNATLETCLRASTAFPGLRIQHWDIALSDRGPVVLEVNIGGDLDLPQLARGEGFLDADFEEFRKSLASAYSEYS